MKKYFAPEFEEVKYDVKDCLTVSGELEDNAQANGGDWEDDDLT